MWLTFAANPDVAQIVLHIKFVNQNELFSFGMFFFPVMVDLPV